MEHTSVDAYRRIVENGLLKKLQLSVYQAVHENPDITGGEVWRFHLPQYEVSSTSPRFKELENMGVIHKTGERPCKTTGVNSVTWRVTGQLPSKLSKKETKKQIILRLTARIVELENLLEGKLPLTTGKNQRLF